MTDKLTPSQRSWNMGRIRSSNTKPEMLLRSYLHRIGFRFRLHRKDLPGKPDIVLSRYKTIIFVQGCFWHQHPSCSEASRPKSNVIYWNNKLKANVKRDRRHYRMLKQLGWRVLRFWECEVEKNPKYIALIIHRKLRSISDVPNLYKPPSRSTPLRAYEARVRSSSPK